VLPRTERFGIDAADAEALLRLDRLGQREALLDQPRRTPADAAGDVPVRKELSEIAEGSGLQDRQGLGRPFLPPGEEPRGAPVAEAQPLLVLRPVGEPGLVVHADVAEEGELVLLLLRHE